VKNDLTALQLEKLLSAFSEIKAETDSFLIDHFDKTFVHTKVYDDAQIHGKPLLVGRKGAGKTALLYGFRKEQKNLYVNSSTITLDNMPFNGLFNFFYSDYKKTIQKLSGKSDITDFIELEKITCFAWKNAILGVSILSACKGLKSDNKIWSELSKDNKSQVEEILNEVESIVIKVEDQYHVGDSLIFAFLFFFFTGFQELIEANIDADAPNIGALLAKLVADLLSKLNKSIEDKLRKCGKEISLILSSLDKKLFIGVDKFDDYYDKFYKEMEFIANESDRNKKIRDRKTFLTALLEGLILAARDLKTYKEFSWIDTLFAIPMDKFLELHLRERNDLERRRVIYLQWSPPELFSFANKRIKEALNLPDNDQKAWYEIFPSTVPNGATNQPEDSFLYVARHSLWKPREIQMHIGFLLEQMQKNKGKVLSGKQIRESIKISCREIVRQEFREEFAKEYPGINSILNQLENSKISTVMRYQDVCNILQGEKLSDTITSVDGIMIRLYKMGVIGVRVVRPSQEFNHIATIMQNRVNVCYKFHYNNMEMNPFAPQSSIVAFHPMFMDVIAAEHTESYIVNELKWGMWHYS
jgi:hypothetical protein